MKKVFKQPTTVDSFPNGQGASLLFYQEACRYWLKAFAELPYFTRNGEQMEPPHGRVIKFIDKIAASFVACLLNSTLFYWYYSAFSDCEHVNDKLLRTFNVPREIVQETDWKLISQDLTKALKAAATRKTIKTKQGHVIQYDEMNAAAAKEAIDGIDCVLAKHYGFTDEELDFIVNYDIKYRLGADGGNG